MKAVAHLLCLWGTLALSVPCAGLQVDSKVVTISEPASVSLKRLFQQADLVAFVEIRAGDGEDYKHTIYKAEVTAAYKGVRAHDTIYFGPFVGYGIGNEYLVFLRKCPSTLDDLLDPDSRPRRTPFAGREPYHEVMYDGYSAMPVDYECVYDDDGSNGCDYGVRINVEQVTLPGSVRRFPPDSEDEVVPDVRHVRRNAIEAELAKLGGSER